MTPAKQRHWRILTLGLLVVGYSLYYLCRSNLSVATPLLIGELVADGLDPSVAKIRLGTMVSLGTLAYALGKFLGGPMADTLGGRFNFLVGMAGSAICTVAFALAGGMPFFTVAWMGNRLVQSLGWSGVVKMGGRWFNYTAHGAVMGFLALSYLFGDALARAFMGELLAAKFTWRAVFLIDAVLLASWGLLCFMLLHESPRDLGGAEGTPNPANLFPTDEPMRQSVWTLLRPFLMSRLFWYACGLSLALTLLRETFNTWTPTYLTETSSINAATAARQSALFPLLGGIAVLAAGWLSDVIGRNGRALVIFVGLILTGGTLWIMGSTQTVVEPLVLVSLAGFLLMGPYSYLSGAMSLDFGGQRGGATAAGLLDGFGYLAGILAGDSVARLSAAGGWSAAFHALAGVAWLAAALAGLFWFDQSRKTEPRTS